MPKLPLLAEPESYRPCIQDLLTEGPEVQDYWLSLFEAHLETLASLPQAGQRRLEEDACWSAFREDYLAGLAELRQAPGRRGSLTVLELTRFREEQFAAHGFADPFAVLKRRENDAALAQFAAVLADIDRTAPPQRIDRLVRGLFAGNLFDMGSKAAVDAFGDGADGFLAARDRVRSRPWPVDGLDGWTARLVGRRPSYQHALFFVDNAGPDLVLGVVPLVREMVRLGICVVLAANSLPALIDGTADELAGLLKACRSSDAELDEQLRERRIRVVASGCAAPLIDLTDLTSDCCDAAAESDLLILEGMGRAIESNYDARFTVDAVKLALIKDKMVARVLGVELFDPVFRFDPASERRHTSAR